jgi:hypothetical protein
MGKQALGSLACGGLLCAAMAACGGDDDGGGDDGSGVDPEKTLAEASSDDSVQICEWYIGTQVSTDVVIRFSCYVSAVAQEEDNPDTDCEAFAAECRDLFAEVPEEEWLPDCADMPDPPACEEVTVGEYEDCLASFADRLYDNLDSASCELSSEELEALFETVQPEDVEECADLLERCPELRPTEPSIQKMAASYSPS